MEPQTVYQIIVAILGSLLTISEILGLLPDKQANGIMHALANVAKPMEEEPSPK